MIKKIIIGIYSAVFLVAIIVGILSKQTYTNITQQDDVMDYFSVALLNSELASGAKRRMEEELPNANIILKVKAEGEIEHMFKRNKQLVSVTEVYKGENIKKGDKVFIVASNWQFFFDDMTANMGFINLLEKDSEYLVFIDDKVKALDTNDNNTYHLIDTIIAPVFNYKDKENTIIEVSDDNYYVPYSKVSKNEFFVSSKDALDKIENLKYKLLAKYDK